MASPGQTNQLLLDKISDFLNAGSEAAWLIFPQRQTLHQFRGDESPLAVYSVEDTFVPAALFPGLSIPVAALFDTEIS